MVGDMHGVGTWRGVCVAGGHAWQGGCVWQGACMAGGHAWHARFPSRQILRPRHTVNERAVRILLECILVTDCKEKKCFEASVSDSVHMG